MRTGVQIPSNHGKVEVHAFNPNADRNEAGGLGVLLNCRCRRIVSFGFSERSLRRYSRE